jgi:uncharacterized membrane protein YeiH
LIEVRAGLESCFAHDLEREIYASTALLGAAVQTGLSYLEWTNGWTPWFATLVRVAVRLASLYFGWRLPAFHERKGNVVTDKR